MNHVSKSALRRAVPPDDPGLLLRGRDPRTGLLTAAAFREVLARRTMPADPPSPAFAMLLVEVSPNGARAGWTGSDSAVAARLRGRIRGADLVASLGAGRFAVVLPGPAGCADPEAFARRLAGLVGGACDDRGADGGPCRIGVAQFPEDGADAAALLCSAEASLRVRSQEEAAPARRGMPRSDPPEAWRDQVA